MYEAKGNPGNSLLCCSAGPKAASQSAFFSSPFRTCLCLYYIQSAEFLLYLVGGIEKSMSATSSQSQNTLKLFMGWPLPPLPASSSSHELLGPSMSDYLKLCAFTLSCSRSSSASGDLLTLFLVCLWRLYSIHLDFLCKIYLVTSHTSLRLNIASSVLGGTLNHLYDCTFILYCNYLSFSLSRP